MKSAALVASVVVTLVLGAVPVFAADDPASDEGDINVAVKFTVGHIESGRAVPLKSYEMIAGRGETARMMTGARVPIPTTSFNTQGGESGNTTPVTSFSYQNVGFTAAILAEVMSDGRIRIDGRIEDSSMADAEQTHGRPIIQTLNQDIEATLDDGVPMRIVRIEEQGTRSLYVDVSAHALADERR